MDLLLYLLFLYTFIAGLTDLIRGKIHNVLSLSAFVAAVAIKIMYSTSSDIGGSLLAGFFCFMCFLPLYYVSIIGGGDVKMMFVLGFIVGYSKALDTVLISFLFAGIFSLVIVIVDGRYRIFFQRLKVFVLSLFYPGMPPIVPSVRESLKSPVAFALGFSAIITYTNIWVGLLK